MVVDVRPIESDGKHYVGVIMDGETNRYGPYADTDEAVATAARLAAWCRAMRAEVHLQGGRAQQVMPWAK